MITWLGRIREARDVVVRYDVARSFSEMDAFG
jgi:hypothetical protein